MRNTLTIPVQKPRAGVVRALLDRISRGAGKHFPSSVKRRKTKDLRDLDQRVRECGEW
jgi:hypothetical protein